MNDIKFAVRQLARKPGFALMVVSTLALGIGATTAIFSVVNASLLRSLPFKEPDQLVRLYTEFPTFPNGGLRRFPMSPPEFLQFQRETKSWQAVEAYVTSGVNLTADAQPVRATLCAVTGGLLDQLGIAPIAGRLIQPSDDVAGAPRVIVISYNLWQRVFGGNTNLVGKEIIVENQKATLIGIMPRHFDFPLDEPVTTETWMPLQLDPAHQGWGEHYLRVIGRLKADVTLAQAEAEIANLTRRLTETARPNSHNFHDQDHPVVSFGYHSEIVRNIKPALQMLFGAVCFVLLIACVNVGNLLLARAERRQREIAIRSAIGAGFWRLVRQFITEGIALSLLGMGLGLLLAHYGLEFAKFAAGDNLPRASEIGIDANVCLFSVALALITGTMFGVAPIAHVLAGKEYLALKSTANSTTSNARAHRFQHTLVVGELALALMLLIGAGLMIRAFWLLQRVNGGFDSTNVLTASVSMPRNLTPEQINNAWLRLEERIAVLPGIESAAVCTGLPPIYDPSFNDTEIEGYVPGANARPQNVDYYQLVTPGYFRTLGIRLVEGRVFDSSDNLGSPDACVINQSMARAFWGNRSAVGRRVRPGNDGPWATIVGVIEDAKNGGLDRPAGTELYLAASQRPADSTRTRFVVARSRSDLFALARAIQAEVNAIAPGAPVSRVRTMDEVVAASRARPRFLTQLLGVFSFAALVLASVGIYGVISYSVAQRTREFGVRMALGATPRDVLSLVLRRGVLLTLTGLLIGVIGAVALTRYLSTLLFGVTPTDPITFGLAPLVLAAVALLATYFPARRATRVDPLEALRYE